ncbi:hypothetical protein, partial [Paeniglutamicibacter sp.]|uniref:hypothetical protein n=1 Tax=Paeniglutamicibacter sp. TaxID=1934391 RepID=UPI003989FA92
MTCGLIAHEPDVCPLAPFAFCFRGGMASKPRKTKVSAENTLAVAQEIEGGRPRPTQTKHNA